MHALIDADILCYEMGSAVDVEGFPLDWPLVRARIEMRLHHIIEMTEATTWSTFLTSQDGTNFRYKIATILPYKGHRKKKDKPHWYQQVYDYIKEKPFTTVVHGQEADDAISITQWQNLRSVIQNHGPSLIRSKAGTVICTKDKDLLMVPGWHYKWPKYGEEEAGPFWITPLEGLKSFYRQLLTGDSADNIHGLHGIGPKSQYIGRVNRAKTELEMYRAVKERYICYYGNYWKFFLTETARLLWMRRYDGEMWSIPEEFEKDDDENAEAEETY